MQGRAAAPGSTVLRDAEMLLSTAHMQRAKSLGNLFSSGYGMMKRGMNPYDSNEFVRSMVGAFAPRTLQRWYSATAEDGLISLHSGNRVMPSPHWFQTIGFSLGLTTLHIEKALGTHNELWEDSNKMRDKIQFYGQQIADEMYRGSRADFTDLINQAMYEGVSLGAVARSVKSRMQKLESDQLDRQWGAYRARQVKQRRGL